MGKWADLVLTGAEQDNAAVESMDRMYQQDMARKNSRPPTTMRDPLPRFGGPKNYPENAASVQPEQVAPQSGKWSSQVLGTAPTQQPVESPPTPKQESWGEWAYNGVMGRQDPREAATGTVYEQFSDDLTSPTVTAALLGTNDEGMGNIIANNLGDRVLRREKDANGYEVMVTRGADGKEQRGYVNQPGLDTQDAWRTFYGAAPYVLGGGAVGQALKGAGMGINALAQGATAGLTSVAGDVGGNLQGSGQIPDLEKAGSMSAFGAAGPVVSAAGGALWRKFVTIPGLVDKNSGMLTAKGVEYARKAGVDLGDITPDFAQSFAKTFAQTKDPAQAAVLAGSERYGIPATRGQVTKDPYLLTQEEGMRRRLYGEQAQNTMLGFDKRQTDAVRDAALGEGIGSTSGKQSVADILNKDRAVGFAPMPGDIGGSIQSGIQGAREAARKAENSLWESGAKSLEATDEALKTLPDTLNKRLGGIQINEAVTPKAAAMAKEIDRIISGEAPEKAAGWVTNNPTRNVDQMRRTLLSYHQAADNGSDKAAAEAIYNGFNDWIGDAAGKSLLSGDPAAALQLVKARGFTREVRDLFQPKAADGSTSPAGARLSKILDSSKTDSGESVIQALFGSHGSSTPQSGAVGALRNIKIALERYTPDTGKAAWDDIRFAYWSRLVTNRGGDMLGPQAIVTNLKAALQSKDGIIQTLYTGKEQLEIRAFRRAVEAIAYKPPNASGSGYTAASFIKDGLLKLLDSFGLGKPANAALNYTGIGNAWNAAGARAAVKQAAPVVRPNLTPAVTGLGSVYNQGSR